MTKPRSASPRAPRGPSERKPGRPRLPSPIASKDSAIEYLRQTGADPEYLAALTRIWRKTEAQWQPPPPAKVVRAETDRALRAIDELVSVLDEWKHRQAWSDPSSQEQIFTLDGLLATLGGGLRAYMRAPASGPHVTVAHADKRLRFALAMAQMMRPVNGKTLKAREVVALAVIEGVQSPCKDEDKERLAIQLWERRWKAAQRIASDLRRLSGPRRNIGSSP